MEKNKYVFSKISISIKVKEKSAIVKFYNILDNPTNEVEGNIEMTRYINF